MRRKLLWAKLQLFDLSWFYKKRFLFFITSSIVKPDSIHCMAHEKWFQNCAFLNDLSRGFLGNKYFSLQIITDWILLIITFFVRFFKSMFSFIFLRCFPNKAWKSEQAASIICSFFSLKTVRFKFHIVQNDRAKIFNFFAKKLIYYIKKQSKMTEKEKNDWITSENSINFEPKI